MNLCECDCGQGCKKRFVSGHYVKTPESKERCSKLLSERNKKLWADPKYRRKMSRNSSKMIREKRKDPEFAKLLSEGNARLWKNSEYRKKMSGIATELNKKRWADPEYRKRKTKELSKMSKKLWEDPEYRKIKSEQASKQMSKQMTDNWKDSKYRKKQSKRMAKISKKMWEDPDHRKNISEKSSKQLRKQWENPDFKEKMSKQSTEILNRLWKNSEYRKNQSKRTTERNNQSWQDPSYREKQIKLILKASHVKPNKLEIHFQNYLDLLFPGEYKYVGDGQLIIGGKCPDFVNVNGKKKLIEIYGDYWHKGQNPEDRKKIFEPFGYKTLVIWEKELKKENKLKIRLTNFHERGVDSYLLRR